MTNSFDRHPYLKTSTCNQVSYAPAHKHVGDEGKPGQINNPVTQILDGYIQQVLAAEAAPKKLTFEEWWSCVRQQYSSTTLLEQDFHACWNAAQANV